MHLYIGDCGIGLQEGILKNYNLEKEITNSKQALSYLFKLPNYRNSRRDDKDSKAGAGIGLKDSLTNIFTCKGKLCVKSKEMAFFMNPVKRMTEPTQIVQTNFEIRGTQYLVILPLFKIAISSIPSGFEEFMELAE